MVAVLDHGLEFNHPDLNNVSPISFDTENGTPPSVVRGDHGVAVAGVIGATRNNTLGVSGVSPDVQLMSISNNLVLAPLLSQRLANGNVVQDSEYGIEVYESAFLLRIVETGGSLGISFRADTLVLSNAAFGNAHYYIRQ